MRYPVGTQFIRVGRKVPRVEIVVDYLTTTNLAGKVVSNEYVSEWQFMGERSRESIPIATIARGIARKAEIDAKLAKLLDKGDAKAHTLVDGRYSIYRTEPGRYELIPASVERDSHKLYCSTVGYAEGFRLLQGLHGERPMPVIKYP